MKTESEMKAQSFESNPRKETTRTAATSKPVARQQSVGLKVKTGVKAGPTWSG